MFAQILIAGIREVLHVVVAVHDEHEREGSWAVGIPHATVDRKLLRLESPIPFSIARLLRRHGHERRSIDRLRLDRDRIPEVPALLVGPTPVIQGLHSVRPAVRRVRRIEQLMGEDDLRVVGRELERLRARGERQRDNRD